MNKSLLIGLTLLLINSEIAIGQNYIAAASKNENGLVELYIRDYCYSTIQWQYKQNGDTNWNSIQNGITNPYFLNPDMYDLDDNVFRAVVQIEPDTTDQFSYEFGIELIDEITELNVGVLYDGTFIYYNNADTILGTFFTRVKRPFGCINVDLPDSLSQSTIGGGMSNSTTIITNCQDFFNAAQYCEELNLNNYNDWFLPSIDELALALQVLGDNKIQQIQNEEFGDFLHNPNVNFSPICVSSTEHNSNSIYASRLSNGTALNFTTNKDRKIEVFPSRNINVNQSISSKVEGIMFPYQNNNVISVSQISNSYNSVEIEYIGEEFENVSYNWDFGQGIPISGNDKGPYVVQFDFGGMNRVNLSINGESCSSGLLYSMPYQVRLFNKIDSLLPESYGGEILVDDLNNNGINNILIAGPDSVGIYEFKMDESIAIINSNVLAISSSAASLGDFNNDSLIDFAICGIVNDSIPRTCIFENMGMNNFVEIETNLPNISHGDIEWVDINNDGRQDIFLTGLNQDSLPVTQIYVGNGQNNFLELDTELPQLYNSTVSFDDFNKDNNIDFILMGTDGIQKTVSIYSNKQDSFELLDQAFTGVDQGDCDWFDYNNDGILDFMYSGVLSEPIVETNSGGQLNVSVVNSVFTRIYNQNDLGEFVVFENPSNYGNINYTLSSLDLADYDNDGFEDILIAGMPSMQWVTVGLGGGSLDEAWPRRGKPAIFKNVHDGFRNIEVDIPSTFIIGGNPASELSSVAGFRHGPMSQFECSSISFTDVDKDGTLDIIREGNRQDYNSALYLNDPIVQNFPPTVPSNPSSIVEDCSDVLLSWDASIDEQTGTHGITYDIYVGTTPGTGNVYSTKNSRFLRNIFFKISDLEDGTYYWGVRARDNGRLVSQYSIEESFEIDCVSNTETIYSEEFSIECFPTPANDHLNIRILNNNGEANYDLIDNSGKVIKSGSFHKETFIETSDIYQGAYTINIICGKIMKTKKVVLIR